MAVKRNRRGRRQKKRSEVPGCSAAAKVVDLIKSPEAESSSSGESDDGEGNVCEDEYDMSVYRLLLRAQTGFPCLSFDFARDSLADWSADSSFSITFVAGTQTDFSRKNSLFAARMSDLRIRGDDHSSLTSSPGFDSVRIDQDGCTNRLRCSAAAAIAASWSDRGKVAIWNLKSLFDALNVSGDRRTSKIRAVDCLVFEDFNDVEGYSLDWSSLLEGHLLSGNCNGQIRLIRPSQSSFVRECEFGWFSSAKSVEDIQWSPEEASVFISCSTDRSICVWDKRQPSQCQLKLEEAHASDVNVISWNKTHEPFLVSGGDDGAIKLWDLRQFSEKKPAGVFDYHKLPVTSVDWHPHERSIFAAASEDDKLSIWDLAVEPTSSGQSEPAPAQMIFEHAGQKSIKEIRWHQRVPGLLVSTAASGFDLIKTINA